MEKHYSGRLIHGKITELSLCEVFVFGSNLEGHHRGGAANFAMKHFGAQWGAGVGPQGQCYAIPTMFDSVKEMKPYVDDFVAYVKEHPMNRFLITRVGCGIAGFKPKDVAPLFEELYEVPNAVFDLELMLVLMTMPHRERQKPELEGAVDEKRLVELSRDYRYEIGAGMRTYLPSIRIRYVIDDNKFGYASFGSCFFFHSPWEMYVFSKDEKWKEQHAEHILMDEFHDQCWNNGYVRRVQFAGVCTPFTDKEGEHIYTGDIIKAKFHESTYVLPVGVYGGEYALGLDNHCIYLDECSEMERLGTVFYGLDREFRDDRLVNNRNHDFSVSVYGSFGCKPSSTLDNELAKGRLTPNYFTDDVEYIVLKHLEAEYDWRK